MKQGSNTSPYIHKRKLALLGTLGFLFQESESYITKKYGFGFPPHTSIVDEFS